MKKLIKVTIWVVSIVGFLIIVLLGAYVIKNSQGVIEPFQVGNSNSPYKILIASQGSEFKAAMVDSLINKLEGDSVFISVVDCTHLKNEDTNDFDACIVIHTMQIHKMPSNAFKFLEAKSDLSNVILVSTSGGGDERFTQLDVDGVSSASFLVNVRPIRNWVVPRVKNILYGKLGMHWDEPTITYRGV
jgi:hypothetical protein